MQKPPGVGNPACASFAKFAAFGPTRSGSVAARSLSGRMKVDTLIFSNSSPNSFLPRLRGRVGRGPVACSTIAAGPRPARFARRPSPASGRGGSLSHMIPITRQRIDHGDLFDREIGHDLDIVLVH